jgi:hypothetical protein
MCDFVFVVSKCKNLDRAPVYPTRDHVRTVRNEGKVADMSGQVVAVAILQS